MNELLFSIQEGSDGVELVQGPCTSTGHFLCAWYVRNVGLGGGIVTERRGCTCGGGGEEQQGACAVPVID